MFIMIPGIFIFITVFVMITLVFKKIGHTVSTGIQSETANQNQNSTNTKEVSKLKKCIYCGSLVKLDATECDSCGGKDFKKHKQR